MNASTSFVRCARRLSWMFAFLCLLLISAGAQSIVPVSGGNATSASAAGGSYLPVFSEDGRMLVYLSHANNLVTNDDSGFSLDVFVSYLITGETDLVSVNHS